MSESLNCLSSDVLAKKIVRNEFYSDADAYLRIPSGTRNTILGEIGKLLTENELSVQQAEILLDVAKARLRYLKIK